MASNATAQKNPKTVMQVLEESAHLWPNMPALKAKIGGRWVETTWREYRETVRMTARAFIALGLEPGQGVAIIGDNSPEWFFADIGAIYAGGVPAGIYTTSSAEQCHYIAEHCDAAIVVVENKPHLVKILEIRDRLPVLKAIVVVDGDGADPTQGIYGFKDLPGLAATVDESALEARISAQKAEDVATLIYTSGTTGQPKAVMISHDNVTWTSTAVLQIVGLQPGECIVSYLPLSHVAEQAVSIHGPMMAGATTCFAESMDALGDNLREIRPHVFLGVPRVWEKIQAKMTAAGAQNSPLKKKIAAWARGLGLKSNLAEQTGGKKSFLYPLAKKVVYDKVRQRLGLDRCRMQITAAAPIARDTLEFFLSLDIPLYEVYGMSECTGPATVSVPGNYRTGKAGFCLPGGEIKIAEDGEICMRGRHVFLGYLKNAEATAETMDADGWLHSGDIGTIDGEGFLQITDRKKDLLITAGGENIAPQVIEGMLKSIPVIAQAVVLGDRMKFLSALVTLDPERIEADAKLAGSAATTVAEAAACAKFNAWLNGEVKKVNERLARVQTIKKIKVLPNELTVEGGELTPTMKIKRKVVNERYAAEIKALYAD